MRKLLYFEFQERQRETERGRQREQEVQTHSEMKPFPLWQIYYILKCSCKKMFLS